MNYKKAAKHVAAIVAELERIREEKGVSAYRLERLTGISLSYLRRVEKGVNSPTLLHCLRVADALEVDLGKIVSEVTARETSREPRQD